MTPPIRVLVVDDSALMRKLIPQILSSNDSIEVVGTAMNGQFCLKKIEELKPQVVTLDLEMPGMNGMDTLREIRSRFGIPVIVLSAYSTEGAPMTAQALSLGAFDFVTKPADVTERMPQIAAQLIGKIKSASHSQENPLTRSVSQSTKDSSLVRPNRIVALGVSTGGPQALHQLLTQLPADFPAAILIVQHMPEGFTDKFAQRMNEVCAIRVKEAQSGELLRAGLALVCPGNRHMKVKRLFNEDVAILSEEPHVNGHRPSVDVLFHSLAEECGGRGIAVLMTGMGDDGARAMGEVKAAGGVTLAQSESTCVVFGMPKAAIERGHAQRVLNLDELASALMAECAPEGSPETASERPNGLAAGSGKS